METTPEKTTGLKVAVTANENVILVGLQRLDGKTDPYFYRMAGFPGIQDDLNEILDTIRDAWVGAHAQWETAPQYPTYDRPPEPEKPKKEPKKKGQQYNTNARTRKKPETKPAPTPAPEPVATPSPQLELF